MSWWKNTELYQVYALWKGRREAKEYLEKLADVYYKKSWPAHQEVLQKLCLNNRGADGLVSDFARQQVRSGKFQIQQFHFHSYISHWSDHYLDMQSKGWNHNRLGPEFELLQKYYWKGDDLKYWGVRQKLPSVLSTENLDDLS